MIDSESCDLTLPQQTQRHSMGRKKDIFIFNFHRDQVVDTEKPAIIDLFGGDFPETEAKPLVGKDSLQRVETLRLTLTSVKKPYCYINSSLDRRVFVIKCPEGLFDEFDLVVTLVSVNFAGQCLKDIKHTKQLHIIRMLLSQIMKQIRNGLSKDCQIAFGFEGEVMIIVIYSKAALSVVQPEFR